MTKRIIFSVLFFVGLFILIGCTGMFFYPSKEYVNNPLIENFSYEDQYFKSSDNIKLHGWLLKPKNRENLGVIFYLHGNAENISTHVNNVLWLVSEGYTVFAFDYRGYGKSEGAPEIHGIHLDAEAALNQVVLIAEKTKSDVFVFGQSLGGAVAVYTVAQSPYKKNIRALIIDSAFSSYRKVAQEKAGEFFLTWPLQYPISFLVVNHYSPVKWIKQVHPVPVLFLHGKQDHIVKTEHSTILYETALEPKDIWITDTKGHITSFMDRKIRTDFLNYLQKAGRQ